MPVIFLYVTLAVSVVLIRFIFCLCLWPFSNGVVHSCLSLGMSSWCSYQTCFPNVVCIHVLSSFCEVLVIRTYLFPFMGYAFGIVSKNSSWHPRLFSLILCIILLCFVFRSVICFELIVKGIKYFLSRHIFVPALPFVEKNISSVMCHCLSRLSWFYLSEPPSGLLF